TSTTVPMTMEPGFSLVRWIWLCSNSSANDSIIEKISVDDADRHLVNAQRSTRCRPGRDACDRECCGGKTVGRIPDGAVAAARHYNPSNWLENHPCPCLPLEGEGNGCSRNTAATTGSPMPARARRPDRCSSRWYRGGRRLRP